MLAIAPTRSSSNASERSLAVALAMAGLGLALVVAGWPAFRARAQVAAALFVPVMEEEGPLLVASTATKVSTGATAAATGKLSLKSIADQAATAALKKAINLIRDQITNWIVTGRFEGPVFATSFVVDASNMAETASRIFLSQLTGINFCSGFSLDVVQPRLTFGIDLGLTCTLPSGFNEVDFLLNPENFTDLDRWLARQPENIYSQALVRANQGKFEFEGQALFGRALEYITGDGFLGIRDEETGKIATPGSVVAKLVMENQVVSPTRQTDVANTLQAALAAIIDTSIRTLIERGLSGALADTPPPPAAPAPPPPTKEGIAAKIDKNRCRAIAIPNPANPATFVLPDELAVICPYLGFLTSAIPVGLATAQEIDLVRDLSSQLKQSKSALAATPASDTFSIELIASQVNSLAIQLDAIIRSSEYCITPPYSFDPVCTQSP